MKLFRPLLLLAFSTALVHAADWPQWRGKDRNDHSPDTSTLTSWPDKGPASVWLFKDAGLGYSGFSVAGGKLFTMGAKDDGEQVLSLDATTGKQLWSSTLDERILNNDWGNGPRGTPTVDGDRVYALSGNGLLGCLSLKDGKILWTTNLTKDHGGKLQSWGYTESVLIDGNKVICTPGGNKGTMAAFDKMSGKLLWQSKDISDEAQYSSPILVEHGGVRQYVQLIGRKIFGVKADSGDVAWQADFPGKVAVIPTPIYSNGHVYVTAGYEVGCQLIKLGGEKPELIYQNNRMVNHHGGVILVDGKLYGHSDNGGWTCQDFKTGETLWQDKSLGKGCCTYVAGHLICVEEDSGKVALVEASTAGWREKSRFKLDPQTKRRKSQGKVWTHPVVVDGRLYLRDQDLIYCYDVKAK